MKFLIATLISVLVASSYACDTGFPNPYNIIVPMGYGTGTTEKEYKDAINKFNEVFVDKVYREYGRDLVVYSYWESETANAFADQKDGNYNVSMFGGLARYPGMTKDGFSLVICHELGHHIGGAPRKGSSYWASAEGQSDYYGTAKCLRELWKDEDNVAELQKFFVPPFIYALCTNTFATANEQALCVRGAYAGHVLASVLASLGGKSIMPMFETADQHVSEFMDVNHPAAQCRLDTYLYGAICPVSKDISMDPEDYRYGTCNRSQGFAWGFRPLCWYKPQ